MLKTLSRLLTAAVIAAPGIGWADYTVQIGALRNASPEFTAAAEALGLTASTVRRDALTLYQVGRYASRQAADEPLARLRAAGYPDAFVRRIVDGMPSEPGSDERQLDFDVSSLSPEQRNKLVVLDGRPHLKEGDRFTPLPLETRR